MFANVNDFRKNNFFSYIWLQCLEQRKIKKRKNQKPTANCKPTTAIHHISTANHHKKTYKPTITAKPTQSKPRTNQNNQIKTHKSSQS
jgi:hypothetical protein